MLESILYPSKIQLIPGDDENTATLTMEPLTQGYGTTIGNALRRVLLSSLPGAAVTAVKIKNAPHEFTAIPGVKEDILEIVLQLKQLRLKVFSDEPVKLRLIASGKKKVTAKDITPSADVEIVNPKLVIATLTDASAELDMEITVGRGRGYSPTEERHGQKLELGTIAIDSLFSPVHNVGFKVENVRVGEITNFDKLVITVETDGSLTPKKAIEDSVQILMNHYKLLENITEGAIEVSAAAPAAIIDSSEADVAPPATTETPVVAVEETGSVDEKPKRRGRKKSTEE